VGYLDLGLIYSCLVCDVMVTVKFIIEVLLVVITLAIILFYIYNNYEYIVTIFQQWIDEILQW